MRISKVLLSLIAVAGLGLAVGCADDAVKDSGIAKKSAPASAPASTPAPEAAPAAPVSAPASSAA